MGVIHQWSETTLYSRLTLGAVIVTVAFHLAAMICKSWVQFTLRSGPFVSVGLFEDFPVEIIDELPDDVFDMLQKDISLYIAVRVLIVMSMVLLYCGLATVLAYCCVKRVKYYRLRLTSTNAAVCAIAGLLTCLALVLYVVEVHYLPLSLKPRVSWSFGLGVLSGFCSFVTFALLILDYRIVSSRHCVEIQGFHSAIRAFRERF